MTFLPLDTDYYAAVEAGEVPGATLLNKFGRAEIGTSLTPISRELVYQTPTTATVLEFVSDDANDTSAGTGAREISIIGLNSSWEEVMQTVTTNGTTAVALSTPLIRMYRWYVTKSGTYATSSTGSHAGTLTIQESGGGTVWSSIGVTPFPTGQSQIGITTIPIGKRGVLLSTHVFVDTSKSVDLYLFQRPNADVVTAPYTGAMRVVREFQGVTGPITYVPRGGAGAFVGPCDIGFMGQVTVGTAAVSCDFELLLLDL